MPGRGLLQSSSWCRCVPVPPPLHGAPPPPPHTHPGALLQGGAYGPGDSVSLWCAVRGGPWGGAALVRDGAHLFPPPSLPPGEYAGVLRVERRGAGGGGGGVSWEPFPADRSEDNGFGGRNAVFAVL